MPYQGGKFNLLGEWTDIDDEPDVCSVQKKSKKNRTRSRASDQSPSEDSKSTTFENRHRGPTVRNLHSELANLKKALENLVNTSPQTSSFDALHSTFAELRASDDEMKTKQTDLKADNSNFQTSNAVFKLMLESLQLRNQS